MRMDLTLPALERLIGGDTQIELAARKQIVEHFASTQLKSLIRDEAFNAIAAEWQKEIAAHVAAAIAELKAERDQKAADLSPKTFFWDFRSTIEKAVNSAIDEKVTERIDRYKRYYEDEISRRIKEVIRDTVRGAMTKELIDMIREDVTKRLDEMLKANGEGT